MITLNLTATRPEEIKVKEYLENNVSEVLAEKINNGVQIVKDGKTLLNKKTLETFGKYAYGEAQKLAEKGARGIFIDDPTVFGWAIHYFEEDSIEGILFNEDGTEFKPAPKITPKPVTKLTAPPPPPKPKNPTLFDLLESQTEPKPTVQEKLKQEINEKYPDLKNNVIVCGMPPLEPEPEEDPDIYNLDDF